MVLSEVEITINLLDSNDNSPVFVTSPVVFSVSEDANIGDIIGVLNVSIFINETYLACLTPNLFFNRPQMLTAG